MVKKIQIIILDLYNLNIEKIWGADFTGCRFFKVPKLPWSSADLTMDIGADFTECRIYLLPIQIT